MKNGAVYFFLAFGVLPLAAGLVYALLYSLGLVGALAHGFSLHAWSQTLGDSNLWIALGLSGWIAALAVLLSSLFALGLMLRMRPLLEQPRTRFLLHFPLALPPIVAAFLSFQWLGSTGMLARIPVQAGLLDQAGSFPPLINDPYYIGVIITMILSTFPFLLLVFMQQFRSGNLLQFSDLAATLGASKLQIRNRVIVPVLLRRTSPTLLLYWVFLFGAFELPLLLGRQNPAMISMFIHQKFRRFNLEDLPVAYVATVIYALVVMIFVSLFRYQSRANKYRDNINA